MYSRPDRIENRLFFGFCIHSTVETSKISTESMFHTICLESCVCRARFWCWWQNNRNVYREHITILSPNISSGNKRNAFIFIHFGIMLKNGADEIWECCQRRTLTGVWSACECGCGCVVSFTQFLWPFVADGSIFVLFLLSCLYHTHTHTINVNISHWISFLYSHFSHKIPYQYYVDCNGIIAHLKMAHYYNLFYSQTLWIKHKWHNNRTKMNKNEQENEHENEIPFELKWGLK